MHSRYLLTHAWRQAAKPVYKTWSTRGRPLIRTSSDLFSPTSLKVPRVKLCVFVLSLHSRRVSESSFAWKCGCSAVPVSVMAVESKHCYENSGSWKTGNMCYEFRAHTWLAPLGLFNICCCSQHRPAQDMSIGGRETWSFWIENSSTVCL
jgi:hypothetical protein